MAIIRVKAAMLLLLSLFLGPILCHRPSLFVNGFRLRINCPPANVSRGNNFLCNVSTQSGGSEDDDGSTE